MRKNEEMKLGQLLSGVYKKLRITKDVTEQRVKDAWNRAFGATFAKHVRKVEYRNGVLTVYIVSDALRQELFANRSKLRNRINEELQNELVKQVLLK